MCMLYAPYVPIFLRRNEFLQQKKKFVVKNALSCHINSTIIKENRHLDIFFNNHCNSPNQNAQIYVTILMVHLPECTFSQAA